MRAEPDKIIKLLKDYPSSFFNLPDEMKHTLEWNDVNLTNLQAIAHFAKSACSRGEAWEAVVEYQKTAGLYAPRNPWRKCHTEHYWCRYAVEIS